MKVKVTHTVDLDDVPEVIDRVVSSMRESLDLCSSKVKFNPMNVPRMINNYTEVRERLDLIDSQLEDIINITSGWHQALRPSPPGQPPDTALAPEEAIADEEQQD